MALLNKLAEMLIKKVKGPDKKQIEEMYLIIKTVDDLIRYHGEHADTRTFALLELDKVKRQLETIYQKME